MTLAIETHGLTKRWGKRLALAPLDLAVPEGSTFGFIGPNGAGKTTTITILVGLVRATAGDIRVLDHSIPGQLDRVRHRVGVLLDKPGFFPHLSGRANLELLALAAADDKASGRVSGILERVGLGTRGDDRVAGYSAGMLQRLGLGAALLHDPEVLILDEPTNGLDPAGVIDLRELIEELRREGKTVFLSSHSLSDVERLCDTICIVSRGKQAFQGSLKELRAMAEQRVRVRVDDIAAATAIAEGAGWAFSREGDSLLVKGAVDSEHVNRLLATNGVIARAVQDEGPGLEDLFLALTRDEQP